MKIFIECTDQEQREAKKLEGFIKGLAPDAVVQSIPPKEEST